MLDYNPAMPEINPYEPPQSELSSTEEHVNKTAPEVAIVSRIIPNLLKLEIGFAFVFLIGILLTVIAHDPGYSKTLCPFAAIFVFFCSIAIFLLAVLFRRWALLIPQFLIMVVSLSLIA
jgi:hypothetical protein